MKKIILVAFTLALLTSGCKVFKSSKKSEASTPKTETSADTKVFSVPVPQTEARVNPVSDPMSEKTDKAVSAKPVSVRSENFTLTTEDQTAYGKNNFFLIVGSFKSNENASNFKQDLTKQGFKPIILHSETGNYRVCIDSFTEEAAARARIQSIRSQSSKFADSWLLIRK